ncbi:DUF202 domain-containing protein, partial [Streptomyces sp. NPDC001193]
MCSGNAATARRAAIDFVKDVRLWFAPQRAERTFLAWIRTALALVGGG